MSDNGIAKPEDFRRALERSNVERVVLPASGLSCRCFAGLRFSPRWRWGEREPNCRPDHRRQA